ncbi:hypothetical protein EXU85_18275 [Spirosoma sp. KCTC 42546]|uniref:hypothetical protein n=1 Tax=Spirosoma sp. KCTC 42546 TaxID=2520506 RepID=UPI00115C29C5|nr:hypothetical protein [Spirosoma sp. KCTC 42546]QDK80445.1 hypothetical protein EXU85_18275 [Spirosoma sp. KCTC 42546]
MTTLEPMMNQLTVDSKVLRATAKAGKKKSGLCMVSAWAGEHRLVLGQEKVASKSSSRRPFLTYSRHSTCVTPS